MCASLRGARSRCSAAFALARAIVEPSHSTAQQHPPLARGRERTGARRPRSTDGSPPSECDEDALHKTFRSAEPPPPPRSRRRLRAHVHCRETATPEALGARCHRSPVTPRVIDALYVDFLTCWLASSPSSTWPPRDLFLLAAADCRWLLLLLWIYWTGLTHPALASFARDNAIQQPIAANMLG